MDQSPVDQAKQQAGQMMDQAKQQAGQMVEQTKQATGQLMDQARTQVTSQLHTQKEQAVSGLDTLADVLRQTGQQLRDRGQASVAPCVDAIADMADGFTGYLRERDIDQLMGEVEGFARRQPALFFGGAFLLGFMGARFLKSSNRPTDIMPYDASYQYSGAGQHGYSGGMSGQYGSTQGSTMSGYGTDSYAGTTGTPLTTAADHALQGTTAAGGTAGGYGNAGTTGTDTMAMDEEESETSDRATTLLHD